MSEVRFVENNQPFLNVEIFEFFKKHKKAFNIEDVFEVIDKYSKIDYFFEVRQNDSLIGFVFFKESVEGDVEISFGKIDDDFKGFCDLILSPENLEWFKGELHSLIDEMSKDCGYQVECWSAVVQPKNDDDVTKGKTEATLIKNGFKSYGFSVEGSEIFKKPI